VLLANVRLFSEKGLIILFEGKRVRSNFATSLNQQLMRALALVAHAPAAEKN
jgi:hypothetical protein